MTSTDWQQVCAAHFLEQHLPLLGRLRNVLTLRLHVHNGEVWIQFPAGERAVLECLQVVPGVRFFSQIDKVWYRFGNSLPTSEHPPTGAGRPLTMLLQPSGLTAEAVTQLEPISPVRLGLVRSGVARQTSALRCQLSDLQGWIDSATTSEIAAVRGVYFSNEVLLLGEVLPVVPGSIRFWGQRVLLPLGFELSESYSEQSILAAVRAANYEMLLIQETEVQFVMMSLLQPLTRAGLRLAARGA
jgi:hypothetical protein